MFRLCIFAGDVIAYECFFAWMVTDRSWVYNKRMLQFNQLANMITFTRILGVGLIFWMTPYTTNYWLLIAVSVFIFVTH